MFGAAAVGLSLFAVTAICANVAVAHDTGPNSMGIDRATKPLEHSNGSSVATNDPIPVLALLQSPHFVPSLGVTPAAFGTGKKDVGVYQRLRSVSSGLCLDVLGGSSNNGSAIVQFTCHSGEAQQWYFGQVSSGNYQLSAKHSAKCMRVEGGATAAGALLSQQVCARDGAGFSGTRFIPRRVGTTTPAKYQLRTHSAGMCLQVPDSTLKARAVQQPCTTASSFLWTFEPVAPPSQSDVNGRWSPVYPLPSIPSAAALLPNRKVITWSTWNAETFGGSDPVDRTYTVLFDPRNPTAPTGSIITHTDHNMFCPGTAMLADGRLVVNGGDEKKSAVTSIYDYRSNTWSRAASMNEERWYNTSVTVPDGDVFTLGGNRTSRLSGTGEIWDWLANTWNWVPGAVMDPIVSGATKENRAQEHPRLFVAPNGKLFLPGPTPNMQWYDIGSGGSVKSAGRRGDDEFSQNDVTVPFDVGKLLKTGGNPMYNFGTEDGYWPSSRNSYVIDVSSGSAVVTKIAPMKYPRTFANGVVLPNGQVLVVGGLDNGAGFSDDGAILVPELFDPATNSWTELAPMAKPRPYHSVALLLDNGRVLVGGGGLCRYDCPENHPDVEIFSPPYLFKGPRPVIKSAPSSVAYGSTFDVSTEGTVTGFSLIRMSSVTHATNTDQRYMRLASSGTGASRIVSAPVNRNVAPPGFYMLFALNGDAPSKAEVVQIK
ncbi:MAG: DUF1929 domain-containing protein [Pseudomonadota bacterium]|nr:DUF1929 domain-containing protein [Pseudomonadota bacterium]